MVAVLEADRQAQREDGVPPLEVPADEELPGVHRVAAVLPQLAEGERDGAKPVAQRQEVEGEQVESQPVASLRVEQVDAQEPEVEELQGERRLWEELPEREGEELRAEQEHLVELVQPVEQVHQRAQEVEDHRSKAYLVLVAPVGVRQNDCHAVHPDRSLPSLHLSLPSRVIPEVPSRH